MGDLDRQILELLQREGRLSNTGLARRLAVSPQAVRGRVRRLEASGAFRGYRAIVDAAALGVTVKAIVLVRLQEHDQSAMARFEEAVRQVHGVRSCFEVTGAADLVKWVAVPDLDGLASLIRTELARIPGVRQFETSLVLAQPIQASVAAAEPSAQ